MRIRQHLPVDLLGGPDDAAQLLREMPRGVLGLDHHEVVGLEIDLEDKDEAHLALGWENLDGLLHQHVLLGFFLCGLFGIGVHTLHNHFHLELVDGVLLARVHEGEKDPELLTRTNLAKGRIVVEGSVCLDAIVSNVVRVFQDVSLDLFQFFLLEGYHREVA